MATELAETETKAVAVHSGGKLAAFVPQTMEEAWRLSTALAASGMTPKAYGGDRNKIMVGIMAGAEVGLTPFAALQSIAVIGNNPSLWGDGALALVQASGLLEDMEETDDGHTATCRLNRKGRTTPIVRTFSMDDAKKAGLAGKAGPWSQYPTRMRQMRARAFALRDGFSDVLKGLHIAEEVRDYTPMNGGELMQERPALTAEMLTEQAKPAEEADHPETGEVTEEPADEAEFTEASEEPADELSPAEQFLANIRGKIEAARDKAALKKAEDEWLKNRAAYDDATASEIDDLIAAKRRELSGEGK